MRRLFNIGDKFKLSADALDNYGEQYAGKTFHVSNWATHYCKPENISSDPHGHPGWDSSANSPLYSSELPFDLYEWEMEAA